MQVLVSDTSVLIDLARGGLLEAAFSCDFTMIVPDLLYANELEQTNGAYLKKLGLGVVSLTAEEVLLAQEVRKHRPGLSWPDCFALSCAHRENHFLVSGDKTLRNEAVRRIGNVYGLLWILDQMAASEKISKQLLLDGLTTISSHYRCRLPTNEINIRLANWRS